MSNKNNIVLIGNSGCGKTTLGLKLSEIINKKFIDSDLEIEKLENIKIKDIFNNKGESFFRKKEREILLKLLNKFNIILSTGAGIIDNKKNLYLIKKIGLIIYIKSNIKDCINRIKNDKNRPLIINNNQKKIVNIFKKRTIMYEYISNITIDTKNKKIDDIINNILYILKFKKMI